MERNLIVERLEEARAGGGAAAFDSGGRTAAAAARALLEMHQSLSDRLAAAARDAVGSLDTQYRVELPSDRFAAAARDALESLAIQRRQMEASIVRTTGATVRDAIEEMDTRLQRNLTRVVLGPLEDLRRGAGIHNTVSSKIAAELAQFRLPAVEETRALLGALGRASAMKEAGLIQKS